MDSRDRLSECTYAVGPHSSEACSTSIMPGWRHAGDMWYAACMVVQDGILGSFLGQDAESGVEPTHMRPDSRVDPKTKRHSTGIDITP
ncbi:hypothetical protein CHU98_g8022 [Xylaria longipes]|nr:hypothetical protein CHU98_g8022 [Xylaria longipes]